MMKTILCILAFAIAANCMEIKYKSCSGDEKPTAVIKSISIEPCEKVPCVLHKGGSASVTIVFTPTSDVTSLNTVVHGHVAIAWAPFPLDNPDGCKGTGLQCPLKAGQDYKYTFSLPVSKYYPSINVAVKWQLLDQAKKNVVCFVFPTSLA